MRQTRGNFRQFNTMNFPLDCDGLEDMQVNEALLSVIGNIGGNRYKLKEFTSEGQWSGFVFLATAAAPEGEVLWLAPRTSPTAPTANDTIYVVTENVEVSAHGHSFPAAYTKRHLAWGLGSEQYSWGSFSDLKTNQELATKTQELENRLNALIPTPVGSVMMWTTSTPPDNWELCNGQSLSRTEFPELFAVIGTDFGGSGQVFRLPDMRAHFPVGVNAGVGDTDFNVIGRKGGRRRHQLTVDEMPRHRHDLTVNSPGSGSNDRNFIAGTYRGENSMNRRDRMGEAGGNRSHENLPPYFAINFIIRVQ